MERKRKYALEICRLLRRRLVDKGESPFGPDAMFNFRAEDVRVEPGTNGAEVVVLFQVCGKDRLLGFRSEMVDYQELALRENADHEIVEMNVADVLTDLVEDFLTGSISEPDRDRISWLQPRRRRGRTV